MLRLTTATGLALTALAGWCSLGADRRRRVLGRVRARAGGAVTASASADRPATPPTGPMTERRIDRQGARDGVARPAPVAATSRPTVTAVFVGSDRPLPRRSPEAHRAGSMLTGVPRQRAPRLEPAAPRSIPEDLALRPGPPVPPPPTIPHQRHPDRRS